MRGFLICFLLSMFFCVAKTFGNEKSDYFKQETLDSCYQKPMSAAVQNCMIYLAERYEGEYDKQYAELINSVASSRPLFHNYNEFVNSIKNAKKNWDSYIHDECHAEALLNEKESYAYHIDYYSCLAKAYKKRVAYYRNYQY